jgi:hypothetical protein
MSKFLESVEVIEEQALDILFEYVVEPSKTQNRLAYDAARALLSRFESAMETYVHHVSGDACTQHYSQFFTWALTCDGRFAVGGGRSSIVQSGKTYALIAELYAIAPELVVNVLPQIEARLENDDDKDRLKLTRALGQMFADGPLADEHPTLWRAWLARFGDRKVDVRQACVQEAMNILLHRGELRAQVSGNQRGPVSVRMHLHCLQKHYKSG